MPRITKTHILPFPGSKSAMCESRIKLDSHLAGCEPGNGRKANFAFRGASLAYSGRTLEFNLGCLFLQGLLSIRIMSCGWSADSLTYPVDVLRISRGSWGMFPGWYRNAPKRVRIPRSSNHSWTDPKESTDCCGNPHIILWKHVDDPVEECRWSCDGSMLTMPWNPWDIKGVAHCSTWDIIPEHLHSHHGRREEEEDYYRLVHIVCASSLLG